MRRPNNGSRAGTAGDAASALDTLHREGHLADVDLHFGRLIAELDGSGGPELPLAAALASAWTRGGHACLALPEVAGRDWPRAGAGAVRLPALEPWIEALDASPIIARPGDGERRPLVLDRHGRLYLERLRTAEQAVADGLLRLAGGGAEIDPKGRDTASDGCIPESGPEPEPKGPDAGSGGRIPESGPRPDPDGLDAALDRLFPGAAPDDRPREAARTAALRRLCVVSGGPGTGKTTTAAAIVALLIELGLAAPARIALAAPTGKAAARLQEAVRGQCRALLSRAPALEGFDPRSTTVHRWLLHHTRKGLAADALILDEGSMVDLTLMAQVLRVLPDGARLVLLGDASQLASVQPGSVFADLCRAGDGAGAEKIEAETARAGAGTGEAVTGVGTEETVFADPCRAGAGDEEIEAGVARARAGTGEAVIGSGAEETVFADPCQAGAEKIEAGVARAGAGIGEAVTGSGAEETGEAGRGSAPSSPPPPEPDGVRPRQRSPLVRNEPISLPPLEPDKASAIPHGGITNRPPRRSPLASCVVELVRNWRFDERGGLGRLAAAVVRGDAPAAVAVLRDPSDTAVELRPLPDAAAFERLAVRFADERFAPALRAVRTLRGPPAEGAGPLPSFRVLCAHRVGPFGAERFNRSVERRLRGLGLVGTHDAFYPGRPILVTRNDLRTRLSNGDTGVVLRDAAGRVQVWFPELEDADGGPRLVPPARLPPHESFFALTVHRAQGSEYDEVAVASGPADSRVATRELLYTAITRARRRVIVYGSEESVAAAVERPTTRSSGLHDALAEGRAPI